MGANHSYRSLKTREAPSLGSAAWHQPDARRPSYQKTSMAGVHLEPEAPDMPTTACHGHQLRSELGTMRAPQQSVFLERNRSCMKQVYRTIEVLCTSISGNERYTSFSQGRVPWEVATSQPMGILEFTSHRRGVPHEKDLQHEHNTANNLNTCSRACTGGVMSSLIRLYE